MSATTSAKTRCAPSNLNGPLPPGLTASVLADAYRAVDGLKPLLKGLRLPSDGGSETALRRAMDDPEVRRSIAKMHRRGTEGSRTLALHEVLELHALARWPDLSKRFIRKSLTRGKGGAHFLQPALFERALAESWQSVDMNDTAHPQSDVDGLGAHVLAYGLLQPGQANELLSSLLKTDPRFRTYFGLEEASESSGDAVGSLPSTKASPEAEEAPDKQSPPTGATDPALRRAQWLLVVADVLTDLGDDDLAEVLLAASGPALNRLLDEYECRGRWKSFTSRRNAALNLAPTIREAVRVDSTIGRAEAAKLLLVWWGFCAEERLADQDTRLALSHIKEPEERIFRLPVLVEQAGRPSSPKMIRPAGKRELSPRLEKVFLGLWESVNHGYSPNMLRLAKDSWRAEPVRTPREGEHREPLTTNKPQPASPAAAPSPAPRVPERPSQQVSASPVELVPPRVLDTDLGELARALAACRSQSLVVGRLNEAGDFDALPDAVLALRSARSLTLQAADSLAKTWPELSPLTVPPEALGSEASATHFLDQLDEGVRQARRMATQRTASIARELRSTLEGLGLPVPPDLTDDISASSIKRLQEELAPAIDFERRVIRFCSSGAISQLEGLIEIDQARLLQRSESRLGEGLGLAFLDVLLSKSAVLRMYCAGSKDLLARAIDRALLGGGRLPPKTWTRILDGFGPEVLEQVAAWGWSDRLLDSDLERFDASDLELLPQDVLLRCGPFLRILAATRAARLSTPARVEALSNACLSLGADGLLIDHLARALVSAGRPGEAFALVSLAARDCLLTSPTQIIEEVVFRGLLEVSVRGAPSTNSIARLVEAPSLLMVSPDATAATIYLVARHGSAPVRESLRYSFEEQIDAAVRYRPVLVGRWLLGELLNDGSAENTQAATDLLKAAREAYSEWLHGIRKSSAFSGWAPSRDYQQEINAHLQNVMEVVARGGSVSRTEAGVLIERVGAEQDLPRPIGAALRAMREYIDRQYDRLEAMAAVQRFVPRAIRLAEFLSAPETTLNEDMREELRRTPGAPFIETLYSHASEGA